MNIQNKSSNKTLINWTAGLSVFALVTHAIDAPDHLSEWWGYGTFFVIVASFQFFYGIALFLRPWRYDDDGKLRDNADRYGRPYFILGTVLTSLVILVYCVTRTTGMPFFGPEAIVEKATPLSLVPPVECLPLLYCHIFLILRSRPDSRVEIAEKKVG
jgi:hypothetical protein